MNLVDVFNANLNMSGNKMNPKDEILFSSDERDLIGLELKRIRKRRIKDERVIKKTKRD